jgi:hypothetical protein
MQATIGSYNDGPGPSIDNLPDPPGESELKDEIAPDWAYPFPVDEVAGIDKLRRRIRDACFGSNPIEAWSFIIGDHCSYGNKKLDDTICIFNMGTATDCPNIGTENCQVAADRCYAQVNEDGYPDAGPLSYRRRQAIIWSHLDPVTWAKAWREHNKRRRNPTTAIRFNESGDFRTEHDIYRVEIIARQLSDLVDVFTYSASDYLDWSFHESFTLNRSNDRADFGDRRFEVVDSVSAIPEGALRCPHDHSGGEINCGSCRICLNSAAPDVYVKNFYTDDESDSSDSNHA